MTLGVLRPTPLGQLSLALALFWAATVAAEPPGPGIRAIPVAHAVAGETAGVVVLAQISGVVATREGHPLPGALVSVFATDQGGDARFAVTDEQGRFEVAEASPGLYSLRAYLAGFLPSPRAEVLVRRGASFADSLLIQMAALTGEPGSGTLSELRWILQRGQRNVLKERRVTLEFEADRTFGFEDRSRFPLVGSLEGELGVFASSGASLGLAEGRAADSGIAYTRFALPSAARGRWEAEARLMESAFASWAANLAYRMDEFDGHEFGAGIAYQRHVYGDAGGYRPPAAPILNADLLHEPQAAWDGAAFVTEESSFGPASLSTGLTYRRFSYLTGHRGLAPHAVLEVDAGERVTFVGGVAVRVDGPIGEDSALLSRVAHSDLVGLDPSWFRSGAAQRTARYQTGMQVRVAPGAFLGARVFREDTTDQLQRAFESGPVAGGRFDVSNAGDHTARGFAVDWVRETAAVTRRLDLGGRVSWLVAVVRDRPGQEPSGLAPGPDGAVIHDLSAEAEARLRSTGTRLAFATRMIRHPGLVPGGFEATDGAELLTRFDVELVQLIPFADWSGTEWELSFAVRDLFFREMVGRPLLDELAVARAPRRIVGGLLVRF